MDSGHEPFQRPLDLHAARTFEQHRVAGSRAPARANSPASPGSSKKSRRRPTSRRAAPLRPSTRAAPRTPISTIDPVLRGVAAHVAGAVPRPRGQAPASPPAPRSGARAGVVAQHVDHGLRRLRDWSCSSRSRSTMPLCSMRSPRILPTAKLRTASRRRSGAIPNTCATAMRRQQVRSRA